MEYWVELTDMRKYGYQVVADSPKKDAHRRELKRGMSMPSTPRWSDRELSS